MVRRPHGAAGEAEEGRHGGVGRGPGCSGSGHKPLGHARGLAVRPLRWEERIADYTAKVNFNAEVLDSSCLAEWIGNWTCCFTLTTPS